MNQSEEISNFVGSSPNPTFLLQTLPNQRGVCILREITAYTQPKKLKKDKTINEKKEDREFFANEFSSTTKALIVGAFAFIAAQAFNAFFQNLIEALYPPTEGSDWAAVISRLIYLIIVVLLVILVGFLVALTSKRTQKQAILFCDPNSSDKIQ